MEADFKKELMVLLKKHSIDNYSNTPDYILADFLINSLKTWNKSVMARSDWYGNVDQINNEKQLKKALSVYE